MAYALKYAIFFVLLRFANAQESLCQGGEGQQGECTASASSAMLQAGTRKSRMKIESSDSQSSVSHLEGSISKLESLETKLEKRMEEMEGLEKKLEAAAMKNAEVQAERPLPNLQPTMTELLRKFSKDHGSDSLLDEKNDLADSCQKKVNHWARISEDAPDLAEEDLSDSSKSDDSDIAAGSCKADETPVLDFSSSKVSVTCCPSSRPDCAGCARFAGGKCTACAGGFTFRDGSCIACTDSADWTNMQGESCMEMSKSSCTAQKIRGQSAQQACCQCGGGHVTASPFTYPDHKSALGSDIKVLPAPRTASRYTLDDECDMAAFNLTMDGTTGEIKFISGMQRPTETFNFECEVTAHQAVGVVFSAKLSVAQEPISYDSAVLLMHVGTKHPLQKSKGTWTDIKMSCAPDAPWLHISSTGEVSSASAKAEAGGISDAKDETFLGQDGAVCTVSALKGAKRSKTKFVALKPRPWPSLNYDVNYVAVSVGEELPILKPQVPKVQGVMKPFAYQAACSASSSSVKNLAVSFDRNQKTLFVNGHSIFEVSADGEITIGPSQTLSQLFDTGSASYSLSRQKIQLRCAIWALFPDLKVTPVKHAMKIDIQDSLCWQSQTIQGHGTLDGGARTYAQCRNRCRTSPSCSHIKFSGTSCYRYRVQATGGSKVTVQSKVTNCTDGGTCVQVAHKDWYLSGSYCPKVQNSQGQVLYLKEGVTPEETIYMSEYDSKIGSKPGCKTGDWMLTAAVATDFVDNATGHHELGGGFKGCVPKSTPIWSGKTCKVLPALTAAGPEEGSLPMYVVDDPSTKQPEDHWLHPCDCIPPAWKKHSPVNAEGYEDVPMGSGNEYIPKPHALVTGQYVCPSRQLLATGLHYETEEEAMEKKGCEERCKADAGCQYFWHGSQHGSNVCRLFSGCDTLVREFGLSGSLFSMPRKKTCQIADAERCWATSLRSQFLHTTTSGSRPSNSAGAMDSSAKPQSSHIPKKPASPPRNGMVSWYESENAGSLWKSSVGKHVGRTTKGSVVRAATSGYGADRPVTYITGDTFSRFEFGHVLPNTFTICSVSRYTSRHNQGRILDARSKNILHGHWAGRAGVAHYGRWVTHHNDDDTKNNEEWLVLCGTNKAKRVYGIHGNIATANANFNGNDILLVNNREQSKFAVMEVMTWNRALSDAEMRTSVNYLRWKLKAGATVETQHLSYFNENSFKSFGKKHWSNIEKKTYRANLANGYKVTLSGWTHTRDYAKGFLRNKAGSGVAVVTGLTPHSQYAYDIYTMARHGNTVSDHNFVSVNHGAYFTIRQDYYVFPSASGLAAATPRGEIRFEFVRRSHHVHLSGIAIAKVYSKAVLLEGEAQEQASDGADLQQAAAAADDEALLALNFNGFSYMQLHQQCDAKLLMGGMGVEQCARPMFRAIGSHTWKAKTPLPSVFQHGNQLKVSCWTERYSGIKDRRSTASYELLQCVNGEWFNSQEKPGLVGFSCESCVRVAGTSYYDYFERNEQELYFFNNFQLGIWAELGMIGTKAAQSYKYCLQKSSSNSQMMVKSGRDCNQGYLAQVTSATEKESRLMRIRQSKSGKPDIGQCLAVGKFGSKTGSLTYKKCNAEDKTQQIDPASVPSIMWNLLVETDKRKNDLHGAYSSYCGTHGALATLDFAQLFAGRTHGTRTACKFVPLIRFGKFKDTKIFRNKASTHWHGWKDHLADNAVECGEGEALTGFRLDTSKNHYMAECSKVGGLGACTPWFSNQVPVKHFHHDQRWWLPPLSKINATCGKDAVIGSFGFETSDGGKWIRVRMTCCKAGGAPITMNPLGLDKALVGSLEGTYCPRSVDTSGRLVYTSAGKTLSFQQTSGKWCIGNSCSAPSGSALPVNVQGATFQVVNVTDFDGQFEGGGVPKEGDGAMSLKDKLKMLKKPERPLPPPMPALETFKAEMPKYSAECLNYQNLWKKVTETFTNAEDETVTQESKLEADPSTVEKQMEDYHPCEVAKGAGGIFGKLAGQSGATAPENMMYADWNECMQGDINRDLASATLDYHGAIGEFSHEIFSESLGLICKAIPDVMIAPLGAGISLNPNAICSGAKDFTDALAKFTAPAMGFGIAVKQHALEVEGYNACNPMQIGFARAFCDIHCVRDAVIRGDRSIIRNLESATTKTNINLKRLVKWSVESNRLETGWLGDKMDYSDAHNSVYFKEIIKMLGDLKASKSQKGLLVERASQAMFKEMAEMAQSASLQSTSKVTAQDALQSFLKTSDDLTEDVNVTKAVALFNQLDSLQSTLRRAGGGQVSISKSQLVARQLAQDVSSLKRQAEQQHEVLGVYRMQSDASRRMQNSHANSDRHEILIAMDRIWWQLREKLDSYLDTAQEEVNSFKQAFAEMENYQKCSTGYTDSMAVMDRSRRQLRSTWRTTSNLIGELVSVMVDGEALATFRREQGCKSSLISQTVRQTQTAIGGMKMLLHRFRVSGLGAPDKSALTQAITRFMQNYAESMQGCETNGTKQ